MALQMTLAKHLLIAMPSLNVDMYSHSVIFICEHHQEGSVGLIINHPMQHHLSLIFDQLNIPNSSDAYKNMPLLFGGPIQTERGFVIHRPTGHWRSSIELLDEEVTITTSNDIIRALAANTGPKNALVALGYVRWDNHQLEQEIVDNAWLVCPYKSELLYEVPFEQRWKTAGAMLGVDMNQLITGGGHA